MLQIDILSLFPGYFTGPFDESILKRAREAGILEVNLIDIRDFAEGKHRVVDDRPFGGGPGMVLMAQPVADAIESIKKEGSHVIYMSPQGERFNAKKAKGLAEFEHLIILCGHYEGIDQRVVDLFVDESISIGDYILTNGCLPAIVLVDGVTRFLPGALGNEMAAEEDSFQKGIFDCPHYTRPREFRGLKVPEVLLEGNHAAIKEWRENKALENTKRVRPDLLGVIHDCSD